MTLPEFSSYGGYSSSNYGVNSLVFSIGHVDVYFSYKTPVAFRDHSRLVVRENAWGPTTGKHMNKIDTGSKEAKARRVDGETFERLLSDVLASYAKM